MAMTVEELKLECLKLVVNAGFKGSDEIVSGARKCADFVLGTNDNEIIAAARSLADKVKA